MKRFIQLLIINFALLITTVNATVHYVKHGQGNIPPYLTWENAADSIMWAINVSQFGDTIYVANGVYKERVYMIPGLSLIGAGMDSCVIDTRSLSGPWPFASVEIKDICLLTGFKILVANNPVDQWAVWDSGSTGSTIIQNKITSSAGGIEINNLDTSNIANLSVYKNIIDGVSLGIDIFNSNAIISCNSIYPDPNFDFNHGLEIGGYFFNNHPLIDSNYIYIEKGDGIKQNYGSRPTIRNNTIILNGSSAEGIHTGYSDSEYVYNNLIYAKNGYSGIYNFSIYNLRIYNNYLTGNFHGGYYVLSLGQDSVKNNVVTKAARGVKKGGGGTLTFKYNDVWHNTVNYSGFTPDSTNLSVDPMIMNDDSTQGELDFHLQKYSPLIDAGDPAIKDKDSTRSDIGLYGGPWGEYYQYIDLPPRAPVNFSAQVDSNTVLLSWNRNTEADTSYYNVYRDTVQNFTVDSTKKIGSPKDTFFVDIPIKSNKYFYYKVTAVDKQGNQSSPSDEIEVIISITSLDNKPIVIRNYRLYQNFPNPFNPTTKIAYTLKESGYVKLYVYDIKGALVETLVNRNQEGGYHEVTFDGKNLASGVYIYQLMVRSGGNIPAFSDIKKMVLVK